VLLPMPPSVGLGCHIHPSLRGTAVTDRSSFNDATPARQLKMAEGNESLPWTGRLHVPLGAASRLSNLAG
jgi:hypothetical protein